jgi:hypothetical protein
MAVAVIAVLCVVGIVPTRRLAGDEGLPGMFAGCAIGFISAAFAGLLLVTVPGDSAQAKLNRSFMAMAARFAAVVVLGAAAGTERDVRHFTAVALDGDHLYGIASA